MVIGARRRRRSGGGVLLSFAPGAALPGGSTFTRATTATYADAAGVVQTAAINTLRDGHFIGGVRTIIMEGARTNSCIQNRDLTNAAWVKTNCTAAKDQTGADGVANSASSLTASLANATCLQTITLASSARFQSAYVKRMTGAGVINMTTDNGVTWTVVTVTAGWTKVTIPTQTLANPIVGFRIVTSGDAIAIDYVQNENGAFPSSVIPTTAAAVTRAADVLAFPSPGGPMALTIYVKAVDLGTASLNPAGMLLTISDAAGNAKRVGIYGNLDRYNGFHHNALAFQAVTPAAPIAFGDTTESRLPLSGNGSVILGLSVNAAAEVLSLASSPADALASAWSAPTQLWVGSQGGASGAFEAYQKIMIVAGVRTLAELRAL